MAPITGRTIVLAGHDVVAALQPSNEFGRVLAACGGVSNIGSLLWVTFNGVHPRPP